MKKHTIFLALLVFSLTLFAQEIQHEALAINIEVPVRVFKGNTFIDNLTIDDFEIYEDGILQKTEAVYLINKMDIVREDTEMKKEEARKIFAPQVSRNFVFLFEIHEYLPKIGTAIEYFFNEIYVMGDALTVITPLKTYRFNYEALERLSKERISEQLIGTLRGDTRRCTVEYRGLLRDLEDIKAFEKDAIEGNKPIDVRDIVTMMHSNIASKLRNLRYIDENKLLEFVEVLKKTEGPKHVFFFLQKLNIPIIRYNPVFNTEDLEEFNDYMAVDETKIKRIFSDSSITAHMIYVTKLSDLDIMEGERGKNSLTNTDTLDNSLTTMPRVLQDISGNMFSSFKDIAETTGGIVDSSTNAAASFKKAADASENYYLLYYSPKNYVASGKFMEITIKVKGQRYRISHRAGYIAD
ncbi:MAG: hypothetical protein MUP98_07860 [Candidatus Aminicenantes bacterium]|nr:hypothetical protein [Candidatus Aminicenantes bacterium]